MNAARKFFLLVSGLVAFVVVGAPAMASSLSLNFSSAVPGTIQDGSGNGTGLPTRLSGTVGDGLSNDTQLTLNTGAHTLTITPTLNADFNGSAGANAEALGVNLSALGYTGSQDFSVSASFTVPSGTSAYNQIGVYVGNSSTALTRDGFLNFGGAPEAFGTNNVGGSDSGLATGGVFFGGDTATATISRVGGIYTEIVADTNPAHPFLATVTPTFSPNTFLSGDLNVGLYAITAGNQSYSVPFTSFSATVNTPEPGSVVALLGLGLCGLLVVSRRRRRG